VTPARGLWISILFVLGLVAASVVGFVVGTRPVLGLDLEGGVSVILSAPSGTPRAVMDRAAENIRRRVDAFGTAEPTIFVTGTNIEVQIPGLARGSIEERRSASRDSPRSRVRASRPRRKPTMPSRAFR
jgi:preprotein translocase subunit SecD